MIILIKSLFSFALVFLIALIGYRKKSLSLSGVLFAIIVGFIHTVSSFTNFFSLMTFFTFASWVTKLGGNVKIKIENNFKEGGQRTWIQVLSNSLLSTIASIVYISEVGIHFQDLPINYHQYPVSSMSTIAAISSIACCCGDTFASEIGSAFSKSDPRSILGFRKVPRGTNGGISIIGTISSGLGGLLIGISAYLSIIFTSNQIDLRNSPSQWPVIILATLSGLIGSCIDSVLGATVQYTGLNLKTGKIVDQPGIHVKHISGLDILDNDIVNMISSFVTGIGMAFGAFYMLPVMLQLF